MPTFQEIAEQTVASFLNSVVVIDDRAFLGKAVETVQPQKAVAPGRGGQKAEVVVEAVAAKGDFQDIDTQSVIEAFASNGLVCSVLSGKSDVALAAAKAADVVIIDWQMDGDDGARAKELIVKLLESDDGNRSRFISIYSGVRDLDTIAGKLKEQDVLKKFTLRDDFSLVKDNVFITVLSKSGGASAVAWPLRAVANTDLPARIISEYASVNMGLLEHASISALAAIRRNTHCLISRFSKELDAPFVSHRVYSDPIEDVKNQVAPFIASELQAIIEQSGLSDGLCRDVICKWVDSGAKKGLRCSIVGRGSVDEVATIAKYYIENGAGSKVPQGVDGMIAGAHSALHSKSAKKAAVFTQLLGSADPVVDEKKFAALTCLVSSYGQRPPSLGPGTIVFDGAKYYLCVMPACDSARVPEEGRAFPFLLLKPDEDDCAFIVPDGQNYLGMNVELKTYKGINPLFKPEIANRDIVANKCPASGKWCFVSDTGIKKVYYCIATLKPAHAQNIINAWAAHSSRVGLTESAWLQARKSKVFGGKK